MAEDLAQEAFVRVYQARHTYCPTARFSTWFTTIVTRLCLNERRRAKVGPVPTEDLEHLADSGPSPEQSALRAELSEQVQVALAVPPEKQRLAVILHRHEGLSYQEIAASMGVSVSAVESLLHRAKQQLRKSLAGYVSGIRE
jgi:RNA polymerase sigma-70 factor (ECF subfamily)